MPSTTWWCHTRTDAKRPALRGGARVGEVLRGDALANPLRPATHFYPPPCHRQPIVTVDHMPTITLVSFNVVAVHRWH